MRVLRGLRALRKAGLRAGGFAGGHRKVGLRAGGFAGGFRKAGLRAGGFAGGFRKAGLRAGGFAGVVTGKPASGPAVRNLSYLGAW